MDKHDISEIRKVISYCPESGKLTWSTRRFGIKVGAEVGTDHKGYRRVKLFGRLFLVHRVAWAIYYGRWPDGDLDHINQNKSDNRISNLREATRSENMINRSYPKGKSGVTGVSKHKNGWQASIRINNKNVYLGLFQTVGEAAIARAAAEKAVYGEFLPGAKS